MDAKAKELPILFSGEMVRAILEGRKTQTRRVMKPQPPDGYSVGFSFFSGKENIEHRSPGGEVRIVRNPYGAKGDRLWVRETWKVASFMEGEPMRFQLRADMAECEENEHSDCLEYEDWFERISEGSSDELEKAGVPKDEDGIYHWEAGQSPLPWRPSIHMPRWVSRITLEIVAVRVERVWTISDGDVRAEGIAVPHGSVSTHYDHFMMLWDTINAKRGYPWASNPWVWVIEFRKVRPILDAV